MDTASAAADAAAEDKAYWINPYVRAWSPFCRDWQENKVNDASRLLQLIIIVNKLRYL